MGRLILEEIKRLQARGELVTFTRLHERLGVSTRTLSRYLKLWESQGIIARHRVGEFKVITLRSNIEEEDHVIKSRELLKKIFENTLITEFLNVFEFFQLLVYTCGRRRLSNETEFSGMTYEHFFKRYQLDIQAILLKLMELEPLTERQRAIYYALFTFLKHNVRTIPITVLAFFPLYRIPEEELRKLPPRLQLIMKYVPRLLYPLIAREGQPLLDFEEKVDEYHPRKEEGYKRSLYPPNCDI